MSFAPRKCITTMDDSTLTSDKRAKLNLDAMTMIKMLQHDPRTAKQEAKQQKQKIALDQAKPVKAEDEFVSPLVRIDSNRQEGRFARASADVRAGEELLVERPFVAVLLEKYAKTHCENCFVR